MKTRILFLFTLCLLLPRSPVRAVEIPTPIDIPYQKFVLPNGLTVIVHEDHKAPIVAFNIWYHVGSKNEKPGKTGFAHLFEHLMFQGSENFDDDFFQAMERIGATDMNGTTSEDRTNYFEDAPQNALDIVLWMESDRMGHFAGAITKARLDEQRGVVQNEKRQGENQPYGRVEELIVKSTWPASHPYSWTVIGSMEDLNAASLEDVKEWFKTYYGAGNAVVALAGDIDLATAKKKMEQYFGDIPSGPPLARQEKWTAKRTGVQRQVLSDRVPQARIYKVWNIPAYNTPEADYLNLTSDLLGAGKNSRLYKRLVYQDQIASAVSASVDLREIAGQFQIVVTARPGQDLAKIEKVVDEELSQFLAKGPTEDEIKRVKVEHMAEFIRGAERIGGFGGKSDILAMNEVFAGDPAYYKISLERMRGATPAQIQKAARDWLSDGVYVLEVHPFPEYATEKSEVDRKKLPGLGDVPDTKFPALQRASLPNGLKILLAERHSVPVVLFNLVLDAGYASDQFASPGAAKLAMDMLDEGTKAKTSLQISEQLSLLGANLSSGSDLDTSSVFLSALKTNLDPSLDLYGEIIQEPSFPERDFNRLKQLQLDGIEREKSQPVQMALRVFPALLYGRDHAYGLPFTGSGTRDSVSRLTREDVRKFHETWFKADHATLIIAGDTTMNEIRPKVEKLFSKWKPGTIPRKNIGKVDFPAKPGLYLMDRPGSLQSIIFAGHVAPPKNDPDEIAMETVNNVLGGSFTSRINMNLREDKHWSYGAQTILVGARAQRPYIVYAPVQTDKTAESMQEVQKELSAILDGKGVTEEEMNKVKKMQTLELAGEWETMQAVEGSLKEIVRYALPDDYFRTYLGRIRALTLEDLQKAAQKLVHPKNLIWVVVGDRSKIEPEVRKLGLGEMHLINSDGKVID